MQSFYSPSASCMVRYQDFPGSGLPCLFIHGLGCAASYEYPRMLADSAWQGRRAVLFDLPGSGYSDWPVNFPYTTSAYARVTAELAEYLGFKQFWLYGHSMGGSIAIEVAGLMPDCISGLLVSEPNLRSGGGVFSRKITAQSEADFIEHGLDRIIAEDGTPWAGSLQRSAPQAVWRGAKSLVDGITPSWSERFLALDMPRCFIVGEHSLPDNDMTLFSACGIDSLIIADADHSMSWENPSGLAHALSGWIGKQERRRM